MCVFVRPAAQMGSMALLPPAVELSALQAKKSLRQRDGRQLGRISGVNYYCALASRGTLPIG